MATKTKEQKPLTIEIHGQGLDVKATFSDTRNVSASLRDVASAVAEQLGARRAPPESPGLEHDLAAGARLLENLAVIETAWLENAQKLIQAALATRPRIPSA